MQEDREGCNTISSTDIEEDVDRIMALRLKDAKVASLFSMFVCASLDQDLDTIRKGNHMIICNKHTWMKCF